MPDSTQTQPKATEGFPFSDQPPVRNVAETVINPEARPMPSAPGSSVVHPDSQIHRLLFPDFSTLETGTAPESPAGTELAHFEIVDRIGSGGMGSVFLALDRHLQRYVALKVLAPSQAREKSAVQRFLNEARAAARLDFDGIARVHFYGEDRGFHFIAFEYVTGTNIRDLIQAHGPLDLADAVNYTLQVAHALKHTSAAGVVHRDIKPSNIIVNPAGRAKLVDLGLARKESSESIDDLTVAGTTLGTFDYISPEQAQDPRNVDVRSDIYSLGCTLFHMLTGEPPYPQGTLAQKLLDHQQSYVPDPADRNRQVPPVLSDVVRKMMASDPHRRYQTPESLIRDLLKVAQLLGLRGRTPEGLVWSGAQAQRRSGFLLKHFSWIAAAGILVGFVLLLDQMRPEQTERLFTGTDAREQESAGAAEADPQEESSTTVKPAGTGTTAGTEERLPSPDMPTAIEAQLPSTGDEEPLIPGPKPGLQLDPEKVLRSESNTPPISPLFTPSEEDDKVPLLPRKTADASETPSGTAIPRERETAGTPGDAGASASAELVERRTAEPQILLKMGGQEKSFETLEAACQEAPDGAIIELKYNGEWKNGPEKKTIVVNRNLTIRGASGYRPLISFESRESPDESDLRMISLQGGSLELVNVDIWLTVKHTSRENWAVFAVHESDQLRLEKGVTVTVSNPTRSYAAAIFELGRSPGSVDDMKSNVGMNVVNPTSTPFAISVRDAVLRGEADAVLVKTTRPGSISIERSLVTVDNSLINSLGNNADMPPEMARLQLTLDHVTCVTRNSLLRFETGAVPREFLPVSVQAFNNLIVLDAPPTHALVAMSGSTDRADFQDGLEWRGNRNFYDGYEQFWTISNLAGLNETEFQFESWEAIWEDEYGASSGTMTWENPWRERNVLLSQFNPEQALISNDRQDDPAVEATGGESLIGAPPDLPVPPLAIRPIHP